MNFDRSKAMRNAERFIAQGKIRLAIDEYRQVVKHDPRDFGTLNMLGDLYVKESNKHEAIRCYTTVAEHYSKQGFAQKAIAIYNKIARLKPDDPDVSEKLAELYRSKGSLSEAKSHYTTLAEHYMSKGYRMEALDIWKQIAVLDPNNTAVYLNLAEAYLQESEHDEAAEAYHEAAQRYSRAGDHDNAIVSLTKALAIQPINLNCLNAYVRELSTVGRAGDAVAMLEDIQKKHPNNRDVLRLMIDAYIVADDPERAERTLIKLVETEPANYPRFLDLTRMYLDRGNAAGASRTLNMCSEHLLMGGQAEEFGSLIDEINNIDSNDLTAIRLSARFFSWKRDKDGLRTTLEKMSQVAREAGSVEDERYALSQLTVIVPHQTTFSERLDQINTEHGFAENPFDERILQEQLTDMPVEAFELMDDAVSAAVMSNVQPNGKHESTNGNSAANASVINDPEIAELLEEAYVAGNVDTFAPVFESEMDKELASVNFYIDNGYADLAGRTLDDLKARFGEKPEIAATAARLESISVDDKASHTLDIAEIRNEFGIEEADIIEEDGDYDTHYQMAVAYQEMGLLEEAIKEYQDAIALVRVSDGTRRFFQCANLLGHCFMQSGMAQLALTWFQRALETAGLTDEEKQGLWFEIASAFELAGDAANAGRFYEQVYAENVDFRDVGERIRNLSLQPALR